MDITLEKLQTAIQKAAARDTSADAAHWTEDNSLWGHCAVAALVVQDYFGGTLLRIDLIAVPELSYLRSHYVNTLSDGSNYDATQTQFRSPLPSNLPQKERSRDSLLENPDTNARYRIFKERVEKFLTSVNQQTSSPQ